MKSNNLKSSFFCRVVEFLCVDEAKIELRVITFGLRNLLLQRLLTIFFIQEFTVSITEEFVEHLYDGALSIEVYGHPSDEGRALIGRSLADRWSEVCSCVDGIVN